MAETTQTQNATPASGIDDSSSSMNSNAGSDSPQTATPQVDTGSAEGKSADSDESGGAAGDGERRPGRAERRISELTKTINDLKGQVQELSIKGSPVDASKVELPDYSKMAEVTPDQLKSDIIKAAEQIVDLKMQTAGKEITQTLSTQQAIQKSGEAIEQTISKYPVLNPSSEEYDAALDDEITQAYADVLKKDPTYSFTTFIKPFTRILESDTTPKGTSKTESRGRSANRSSAPVKRSNEFPEGGSAEDMEKWFAQNRG